MLFTVLFTYYEELRKLIKYYVKTDFKLVGCEYNETTHTYFLIVEIFYLFVN